MAYYYPEPSHTFSEYLLVPGYTSEDCIPSGCFAWRRGGSAGEIGKIRETFDFLRRLMYTEENRMKNTG